MNRVVEFLDNLDKKNKILLYLSLIIGFVMVYINFNFSFDEKIKENELKIRELKKDIKRLNLSDLNKYKKTLKRLREENLILREDLRYLNMLIKTSFLYLDEKEFLDILENILAVGVNDNIKASYSISKSYKDLVSYNVEIEGSFDVRDYKKFYSFIRSLDKIKRIKSVDFVDLDVKDGIVNFKMIISFWSIL